MASKQQEALILPGKGAQLTVTSIDIPKPAAGQVLVKVVAAALNPVDWKNQKMGIRVKEYPAILGLEGAGIVEEVADGVTNFLKGDRM